jgi:hypothetical protein
MCSKNFGLRGHDTAHNKSIPSWDAWMVLMRCLFIFSADAFCGEIWLRGTV